MATYEQPALWYTEEEVTAKVSQSNFTTFLEAQQSALIVVSEILREDIAEGDISLPYAQTFLDTFAERTGTDASEISLDKKCYTVTVSFNGEEIAEFEDIMAEDEGSAIEAISDGFALHSASAELTWKDNNGYTHSLTVDDVSDDYCSAELEWEATEQE